MRNHRVTVLAAGVLGVGLVLSQQACSVADRGTGPVAPAPTATTADAPADDAGGDNADSGSDKSGGEAGGAKAGASKPGGEKADSAKANGGEADSGKAGKGAILDGKRQVVIRPIPSSESIVAVDAKGRLGLTDGEAEHGLFVLTPSSGKWLIKTAKVDSSGEPSCMGIKNNGSRSLTVVAAPCDASRSGQLFTLHKQKAKDNGRPTYAISNNGAFLQVFPSSGLIAEELGDAPLMTTYSFVDNGPSTLPID